MNILVLQHINIEDPGYIKDLMLADGFNLTTIELDEGQKIPDDLTGFDAMLCMGGPMDTHMEDSYPWLVAEKQKIAHFVTVLEKPFLGFCLGAQLLGEVLGGRIVKSRLPEIGVLDITMADEANDDFLFADFAGKLKVLQWHSYEVSALDNDVTILASSPVTQYQVFRYKEHAYGIQFHIEVREDTVRQWSQVPEYKKALEDTIGADGLPKLEKAHMANIASINQYCNKLYQQFKKLINHAA